MTENFPEPAWLDAAIQKLPAMPSKSELERNREQSGKANLPWTFFLEDHLIDMGHPNTLLLDYLSSRFPAFPPVSLDVFEPSDYSNIFPRELTEKYFVVPFNFAPPFLSVAIVDPELFQNFYQEYVSWAKQHTFSLLQYFIVLPSSFSNLIQR